MNIMIVLNVINPIKNIYIIIHTANKTLNVENLLNVANIHEYDNHIECSSNTCRLSTNHRECRVCIEVIYS